MLTRTLTCLMLIFGVAAFANAQEYGPQPGTKIDEFSLADQHGTSHTLSDLLKQGPTAFVFVRSANW